MLKKILITGGLGLIAYVVNYMRKEYDKNVDDYNKLVDKCNEMSDFINDCDFYRYHDSEASDSNRRYIKETYDMPDGSKQTVTRDVASGFSIVTTKEA